MYPNLRTLDAKLCTNSSTNHGRKARRSSAKPKFQRKGQVPMAEENRAQDEAYWFGKAAQLARRMAEVDGGEAANTLLQVAHMYEAMAWRAAEREEV